MILRLAKRTSAAKAAGLLGWGMARLKACPFGRSMSGAFVVIRAKCGELSTVALRTFGRDEKSLVTRARAFVLMPVLLLAGCGYHAVGSAGHLPPDVRTLAVPIFTSRVQAFRTEVVFTQAVVHELNLRTKYRVLASSGDGSNAGATGDAVMRGTIMSESVAPLTYDQNSGQTASYLVTITASVVITAHDGTVLYKNDAFGWREQYQSTQDLSSFVQEDSAAVRRIGHDFAQALVSDVLEGFK